MVPLVAREEDHWCWVVKEVIPVTRWAGKPMGALEEGEGPAPLEVEEVATEVCDDLSYQVRRFVQYVIRQGLSTTTNCALFRREYLERK